MAWMILPLRRSFDFRGRSRPTEFWMFALFCGAAFLIAMLLDVSMGQGVLTGGVEGASVHFSIESSGPAITVLLLLLLIPGLALKIRRLHDTDRSGWWLLLALIPLFGWIALLAFYCQQGTRGANRFGPEPTAP